MRKQFLIYKLSTILLLVPVIMILAIKSTPVTVFAFIPLSAPSAILMDQNSGTVLFAYNEHEVNYPAGLTKMLTALVALEYLEPDQVIVVGTEIYNVPRGSIMSGHQSGEHITVHNLLRGLMIRNGNDSGAVLALHTVQRERNHNNVPFSAAMNIFSDMMNNFARELGALNTNFVNPNGLHQDDHYTTAYDLALIARAFMNHPLLSEIARESEFIGNSLDGSGISPEQAEAVHTINYHWVNTNELISGGTFHYHYATGIRSGSTPQANDALAASAERREVRLIAIILDSHDPGRWQDARMLFDYGFATYDYHVILETGQVVKTVNISNAMLGGTNILDVVLYEGFTALLSQDQISRLERTVIFNERFITGEEDESNELNQVNQVNQMNELNQANQANQANQSNQLGEVINGKSLLAPIEENEILGSIIYTLDDQILFEGTIKAAAAVEERSLDSDMDYYIALIRDNIFSIRALPIWMGSAGVLIGVGGVSLAIAERRRNRRSWYGKR